MLDYEPGCIPALELGSILEYKPGSLLPSGSILQQEQGRVLVQLQILKHMNHEV